jgi:hypothetical protein
MEGMEQLKQRDKPPKQNETFVQTDLYMSVGVMKD